MSKPLSSYIYRNRKIEIFDDADPPSRYYAKVDGDDQGMPCWLTTEQAEEDAEDYIEQIENLPDA